MKRSLPSFFQSLQAHLSFIFRRALPSNPLRPSALKGFPGFVWPRQRFFFFFFKKLDTMPSIAFGFVPLSGSPLPQLPVSVTWYIADGVPFRVCPCFSALPLNRFFTHPHRSEILSLPLSVLFSSVGPCPCLVPAAQHLGALLLFPTGVLGDRFWG